VTGFLAVICLAAWLALNVTISLFAAGWAAPRRPSPWWPPHWTMAVFAPLYIAVMLACYRGKSGERR